MKLKDFWDLIKQTFKEFSEDKVPRLAAALSYYTIFSLAPMLIILIFIVGLALGEEAAQNQIVDQVRAQIDSEAAAETVEEMIAGARQRNTGIVATVISIATILFGAAGVFGQLHDALNTIWEVAPKPGRGLLGLIKDRFLSFTMVLGIGFLLLVSLVISTALSVVSQRTLGFIAQYELLFTILNFVLSFLVITVLFALIFKILPDAEVAWKDVWLGAAVTSLLFAIGKAAIGYYLGSQAIDSTYGTVGSLIVILLWVYYSAQIMFFGAEFTQVYANRFGSRILPEEHAVSLDATARAEQGIPHEEALEKAAQEKREPSAAPLTAGVGFAAAVAQPGSSNQALAQDLTEAEQRRERALSPPLFKPVPPERLLPEARPSLLIFSSLVAILVGFVSGLVVKRGN